MEYCGFGNSLGNQSRPLFNPEERCILLFGSETSRQVIASIGCRFDYPISRSVLEKRNSWKNSFSTFGARQAWHECPWHISTIETYRACQIVQGLTSDLISDLMCFVFNLRLKISDAMPYGCWMSRAVHRWIDESGRHFPTPDEEGIWSYR